LAYSEAAKNSFANTDYSRFTPKTSSPPHSPSSATGNTYQWSEKDDLSQVGNKNHRQIGRQEISLVILGVACLMIAVIWFNGIMNRQSAIAELEQGQFMSALAVDNTYGPAWQAYAAQMAKMGETSKAIEGLDRAIKLSDAVPAAWYVQRAAAHQRLQQYPQAIQDLSLAQQVGTASDSITVAINQIRLRHLANYAAILADSHLVASAVSQQWQSAANFLLFSAAVKLPNLDLATNLSDLATSTPLAHSGEISYIKGLLALQLRDTSFACTHFNAALTEGDTLSLAYKHLCPNL
jgi:tetratricopeptide (TPR) repeat protein